MPCVSVPPNSRKVKGNHLRGFIVGPEVVLGVPNPPIDKPTPASDSSRTDILRPAEDSVSVVPDKHPLPPDLTQVRTTSDLIKPPVRHRTVTVNSTTNSETPERWTFPRRRASDGGGSTLR